jgi:hypothetical protein
VPVLKDIKDSDKVALLILFVGIFVTGTACFTGVKIIFSGATEGMVDRALSTVKDFFAVGSGLITAAVFALRLQPKPTSGTSLTTTTTGDPTDGRA